MNCVFLASVIAGLILGVIVSRIILAFWSDQIFAFFDRVLGPILDKLGL